MTDLARRGTDATRYDPRLRRIVVKFESNAKSFLSVAFQIGSGLAQTATQISPVKEPRGFQEGFAFGETNSREDAVRVRVGVADGVWRAVGSVVQKGDGTVARKGQGFLKVVRPWELRLKGKPMLPIVIVDASMPTDRENRAYRVLVFDRSGKELSLYEALSDKIGAEQFWFRGKYQNVGRVELQARAYTWTSFDKVRLNPLR